MNNPFLFGIENARAGETFSYTEITLRDLFAGLAMNSIVNFPAILEECRFHHNKDNYEKSIKLLMRHSANRCYQMADAMLQAREEAQADG